MVGDPFNQLPVPIGAEGAYRLPSAHRTVRTGPYTAPHVTLIHRLIPNQCFNFAFDLSR